MFRGDLEEIVDLVKRIIRSDDSVTYRVDCEPHVVVQTTFEKQGINKVIQILEGIANGTIKTQDFPRNE